MYVILSVRKAAQLGLKSWCIDLLREAFYILLRLEYLYTGNKRYLPVICFQNAKWSLSAMKAFISYTH